MARELLDTGYKIETLGVVGHEDKHIEPWSYRSVPSLALSVCGIKGDRHYGGTRVWRTGDSTDLRGRIMPNDRQLSIVSQADLLEIARGLDLPISVIEDRAEMSIDQFMAEQLAANMVLSGDANLNTTFLPGALLVFGEDDRASPIIRVTEYNDPCKHPIRKLVKSMEDLGKPLTDPEKMKRKFIDVVAVNKRGWVGAVIALSVDHRTDAVSVGQSVRIHEPLLAPLVT